MHNRKGPKTKKARGRHLKDNTGRYLSLRESVYIKWFLSSGSGNIYSKVCGGNRLARNRIQLYTNGYCSYLNLVYSNQDIYRKEYLVWMLNKRISYYPYFERWNFNDRPMYRIYNYQPYQKNQPPLDTFTEWPITPQNYRKIGRINNVY